jgi:hypothetical protein
MHIYWFTCSDERNPVQILFLSYLNSNTQNVEACSSISEDLMTTGLELCVG